MLERMEQSALHSTALKNIFDIIEKVNQSFQDSVETASHYTPDKILIKYNVRYHSSLNALKKEIESENEVPIERLISLTIKHLINTRTCLLEILKMLGGGVSEKIHQTIILVENYLAEYADHRVTNDDEIRDSMPFSMIDVLANLEKLRAQQTSLFVTIEKNDGRLIEIDRNISTLNIEANHLEKLITEKISEIEYEFSKSFEYLRQKKIEVDEVIGLIAGKAVAGSYEKSASEEQSTANWLRYGAIAFMVVIVTIIGYTLIESVKPQFSIEVAILRVVFTLLLSVPAAYLARESAKHRQQEYTHLQTSLDLKAITPYIASLPSDTQNKLKEEMASRIFSQKNFDHITKESYPYNVQDILMAALEKLELKKSNEDLKKDA